MKKKLKGSALLPKAERIRIARLGGLAVAKKRGRKHMAMIGAIGGAS
jgi:hypothetical protein